MTTLSSSPSHTGYFPIRRVAELTGINPVTLRAWERRHGLITPKRTPKGHRLYSEQDIALIRRIQQLLREGISIGQVPELLSPDTTAAGEVAVGDSWAGLVDAMLAALQQFNLQQVEAVYNRALALYPVEAVHSGLVSPVMMELGRLWQGDPEVVAEEHFFSTYLRNKVGARLHHLSPFGVGKRLILACLPDERHELGLLLFSLALSARGYQTLLLGADLPVKHLVAAARRTECDAVILSGTMPLSDRVLQQELQELRTSLVIPLLIGGGVSVEYADPLTDMGYRLLGQEPASALIKVDEYI